MHHPLYRTYQFFLRTGAHFLPWRAPRLIEGENCLIQVPALLKRAGVTSVLIVTGPTISKMGMLDGLYEKLREEGVAFSVYNKTVPNPTIDNIEEALGQYLENNHNGIIAFGGGSPMDCAKGVGARVARPNKSIPQMKGLLKVNRRIPPLFAIPTTAGSGSEATIAAVVSNAKTHEKYALMDMALIPHTAVLDPTLTCKLPQHVTSTTGMDALTHAVEAYIGTSNTRQTLEYGKKAVKLIFENLYAAYCDGSNLAARANMQRAAYYAGVAFTRAYVGNVHAIAHTLGGFYSVPHGLANAVILPYVLAYYGKNAHKALAELADVVGIGTQTDSQQKKAEAFIEAISQLNKSMEIPNTISGIMEADIPVMVDRAYSEANPTYPVPMMFSKQDFRAIFENIRE